MGIRRSIRIVKHGVHPVRYAKSSMKSSAYRAAVPKSIRSISHTVHNVGYTVKHPVSKAFWSGSERPRKFSSASSKPIIPSTSSVSESDSFEYYSLEDEAWDAERGKVRRLAMPNHDEWKEDQHSKSHFNYGCAILFIVIAIVFAVFGAFAFTIICSGLSLCNFILGIGALMNANGK